jgi:hypothetical protein
VVDLTIPAEAFLDPLATSWLTGLRVETSPVNDRGAHQEMAALAFLLWQSGSSQPPILWSRDEAGKYAPFGTTNAAVHAEFAGQKVAVAPPIPNPVTSRSVVLEALPETDQSAQRFAFPEVTP